ncbi:hypothetical protein BDF19DRAFT_445761 [Syncephalis fuscata]|nr:hypothetical protein BDF19DRAFT_445761 [Syncephalis fuscata]
MEAPLPTEGTFDVIISDTFTDSSGPSNKHADNLVILKYNKQVAGAARNGTLSCNDKTGDALLGWGDANANGPQFTGKRADARATDCLLVFDPDTNSFTLEHQPQVYQFQYAASTSRSSNSSTNNKETEENKNESNTTLMLPTRQTATTAATTTATTKSNKETIKLPKKAIKARPITASNAPIKQSSPVLNDDFEDDFIEVDPVLPSSSNTVRHLPSSVNQKPSIYTPVTVNTSNIAQPANTAANTDIYSSTSSDDDDDDISGTSSDSGTSSSGSSDSSSDGDGSESTSDSDEEKTRGDQSSIVKSMLAKVPPPINSPIDDNDEMNIDDLDDAIAAAMEDVEEKKHDDIDGNSEDDDNYDWLENEIEAEIS